MGLKVLFKTKGGHKQGIGDVTSSLDLADEFRESGHNVCFIINNDQSVMELLLEKDIGYRIAERLPEIEKCIEGQFFDVAILNQLNTLKEEALLFKKISKVLVTIDDTGKSVELADLRFNVLYPIADAYTDFKYIALSSSFQKKHAIPKVINEERVKTILVMQGGSDTHGYTPKIVKALYGISNKTSINIILGPNFSHDQELYKVLSNAPRCFNIIKGNDNLSDLMLQSDLAITAAGNTIFELACLGVPCVVICAESFEVETANRLENRGFGINLGFGEHVSEFEIRNAVIQVMNNDELLSTMSITGKKLVDGKGRKRIVNRIAKCFENGTV
ncbi:MAG: PseG/SpsG family protein [Candidatus Anammoxibacter sp.]